MAFCTHFPYSTCRDSYKNAIIFGTINFFLHAPPLASPSSVWRGFALVWNVTVKDQGRHRAARAAKNLNLLITQVTRTHSKMASIGQRYAPSNCPKNCKMQRNSQKCREIHRNAEKCREMHRYAEKFRKMQRNLKNLVEF